MLGFDPGFNVESLLDTLSVGMTSPRLATDWAFSISASSKAACLGLFLVDTISRGPRHKHGQVMVGTYLHLPLIKRVLFSGVAALASCHGRVIGNNSASVKIVDRAVSL